MKPADRPPYWCRPRDKDVDESRARDTHEDEAANSRRRIDSQTLFANSRALVIQHEGSEYLLRITSQGKLILTK